ncbi:hypothetical protein D3C72_2396130 [compost metagenome]
MAHATLPWVGAVATCSEAGSSGAVRALSLPSTSIRSGALDGAVTASSTRVSTFGSMVMVTVAEAHMAGSAISQTW